MPTLTQLEYLLQVVHTGHFGRAAKACHISQPTLSSQIAKAEEELGVIILDRRSKPIGVTEAGQSLVEQAREVIAAHATLLALAQGKKDVVSGDFALGIIPTISPYLLPYFLSEFAQRYPLVKLSIHELTTEEIIGRLHRQELDAAILATPLREDSIIETPLFYDRFLLYAHKGEALLRSKTLHAHKLEPDKLWLLSDGHCFRNQVINYCNIRRSHMHFGSVSFVAGTIETLRNLIDSAGGYTLVPEIFSRTLPAAVRKAQIRPFTTPTPTREISIVHHKRSWKTSIVRALSTEIDSHLPQSLQRVTHKTLLLPIR